MHTYDCTVTLAMPPFEEKSYVFVPTFSLFASNIDNAMMIAKSIVTASSDALGVNANLTGIIMVTKARTSIRKEFFFIDGVEVTREAWRNPNR